MLNTQGEKFYPVTNVTRVWQQIKALVTLKVFYRRAKLGKCDNVTRELIKLIGGNTGWQEGAKGA